MSKAISLLALYLAIFFSGCGENSPIQWRGFGSEQPSTDARSIDPRELDLCRFQLEAPRIASNSITTTSPSTSTSTAQSDAAAFQNQIDVEAQLFGDAGGQASPSPSTNTASQAAASNPNAELERIVNMRVLQRDDIATARVTTLTSRDATLQTSGIAQVTRTEYVGNRLQTVTDDNARVSLNYQLTRSADGWRCLGYTAAILPGAAGPQGTPAGGGRRIGW